MNTQSTIRKLEYNNAYGKTFFYDFKKNNKKNIDCFDRFFEPVIALVGVTFLVAHILPEVLAFLLSGGLK